MDSLISAAARALAAGDPLGALKRVSLRADPPALALRGIAMAQLGDYPRAKALLRQAGREFGPREAVSRARCVVAEAEIALVSRDLRWPARALAHARATLDARGDRVNAAHAQYLDARRALLIGRIDDAERGLAALDPAFLSPPSRIAYELVVAGIAIRRLRIGPARDAFARAATAARGARIPSLRAEVERAAHTLDTPAARLIANGLARPLLLGDVESLLSSKILVVDACRHVVRQAGTVVGLTTRPVLFALARALAEAWPQDAARNVLVVKAFGGRVADESHRARLRVEIGRLRRVLHAIATVNATTGGFALVPRHTHEVVVLAPPSDASASSGSSRVESTEGEQHGAVLALLADGEAWSSSALALALGTSQRSVQRALNVLAAAGKVEALGHGRARRWLSPPLPGFTTTLLLPGPLPI
jgi:hypothetical protein